MGSGAVDQYEFLAVTQTVWSASVRDPNIQSSGPYSGKLQGSYRWEYRINLPGTVHMVSKRHNIDGDYPIPTSFHEEGVRVSVQYEISCHIRRSALKVNSK
jgi:hypothetical protein